MLSNLSPIKMKDARSDKYESSKKFKEENMQII